MMLSVFLIWLAVCWLSSKAILVKVFDLDKKVAGLLAVFLPIFILGPLANVFTAWFRLDDQAVYLSFLLSWAGLFLANRFLKADPRAASGLPNFGPEDGNGNLFVFSKLFYLIFGLAAAIGFYFIFQAAAGNHLASPWEVINGWQAAAVAVLSAIIIYAIYSRKIPQLAILLMIIIFSLLIHSYLLVYKNGFGGDRFRHLASEERILSGLEYQPTLLAGDLWFANLGPIAYPQALTDSAKLSYGTMWSLEAIAAKISGWPVFQINRYGLPILWSIFLTVIIYALAYLLKPEKKFALLAAWLANSFYLLQYYGAQGLPASYGLLWLAFYSLFLIGYLKNPNPRKLWLLLGGLALMYFNYSLVFLLCAAGLVLAVALVKKTPLAYWLALAATAGLIGLDYLSSPALAFSWAKILPAWSFGNLIDFQALSRLAPFIGEWRRIIEWLLAIGFAVSLVAALVRIIWKQDRAWLFAALMAMTSLAAYFLSYWFLAGGHLLSRRLTLFAALFLVLIFAAVAARAVRGRKSFAAVGLVLISLTVLTYYSGPVLDVSVADSDLARAQELWPGLKDKPDACVQEPLPVILALEYVSAKEFQETINDINCNK